MQPKCYEKGVDKMSEFLDMLFGALVALSSVVIIFLLFLLGYFISTFLIWLLTL